MATMTERDLLERGYVIVGNRAVKRDPKLSYPGRGTGGAQSGGGSGRECATPTSAAEMATADQQRATREAAPVPVEGRAPNKYRAVRTEGDGPNGTRRTYDSAREARHAAKLNARKATGEIVSWIPQVSVPIGVSTEGRDVRYRADALEILEVFPDGTFRGRFSDPKGIDTPASRAKRAALKAQHGVEVELV